MIIRNCFLLYCCHPESSEGSFHKTENIERLFSVLQKDATTKIQNLLYVFAAYVLKKNEALKIIRALNPQAQLIPPSYHPQKPQFVNPHSKHKPLPHHPVANLSESASHNDNQTIPKDR